MNTVGTVLTLAVLAVVVLVATDTLRVGAKGPSLASGKTKPAPITTQDAGHQIVRLKTQRPVRPLSHAAPLRLWVGGDSLAGDLGYQLGPMLTKTGIVQAHVDYKVSSGLASDNVRDWPENFTQENTQYSPEATVFMVGANDASIVGSAVDASGTPVWETKYRSQVDHMMDLLVGTDQRTVFWIGSPPLDTRYNHGAEEVDRVMREEAAKRPTVVYVDAYKLFSVNGEFSDYLTDADGQRVRMRTSDGVHLTVAGGEFLAEHIFQLLDQRWNLASQAAPEEPIDYTIEPKSGTIGGVHLRNTHPATTTTAPTATTAAPTTTKKPTVTTVAPTTTTRKHGPTTTAPPTPTT